MKWHFFFLAHEQIKHDRWLHKNNQISDQFSFGKKIVKQILRARVYVFLAWITTKKKFNIPTTIEIQPINAADVCLLQ